MKIIITYIINMLPYILIALPVYLIIRLVILKTKSSKPNIYHEIGLLLFVLFLVGLASQTIIPKIEFGVNGIHIVQNGIHQTNLIPLKVIRETYIEVWQNKHFSYFLINFLGNIVMFVPIGFLTPLLFKVSHKKVILIGFCSSFFIEFCQLFLTRGTDIDDLILNTLGTWLGLCLYKWLNKHCHNFVLKFR